ncbi:cupin domain-containing protein [Actinoplanes sp. NEAU-A12]|uniref:Cupin domain-containing protein n=1 Tax=Actinoplanes sandaracinus TaxID=3045177 RepID=A0ABT6WS37_9ACTN|nr:cupin domain-containing protein [Actinoplanes sandaracinus]MDI6102540.1 cupin domain-containing protein [Actinoplanes sandaracinus]
MRGLIRLFLAGLVVSGAVMTASPAHATTGRGVTAKVVWQWTVDDTDYVLREITITPGGSTGWHRHPGLVFANVRRGTLTHLMADCVTVRRYKAGESLMEEPQEPRAHMGENRGGEPLILDVVYASPQGVPLSTDAADPGC